MAGKQAKILSDRQVEDLLFIAAAYRNPVRNRVMVLLSVKAGLRAAEIANLDWEMALDGCRQVGRTIELRDSAAKNGSGRVIPIHPDLHDALEALLPLTGPTGPVVRSERGGQMTAVRNHSPACRIHGGQWARRSTQATTRSSRVTDSGGVAGAGSGTMSVATTPTLTSAVMLM